MHSATRLERGVGLGVVIALILVGIWAALVFQKPTPAPAPAPTPVATTVPTIAPVVIIATPALDPTAIPAPDTGWHRALEIDTGRNYLIVLPYVSMTDAQKDDANRFGRAYPSGTFNP